MTNTPSGDGDRRPDPPAIVNDHNCNGSRPGEPPGVRVLMVDGRTIVRQAVALLVEQDPMTRVVGHVGAPDEVVDIDDEVDVLLTEYGQPDAGGASLIRRLADRYPRAGIVVLTTQKEPSKVEEAIAAGARGYILESGEITHLHTAIRKVAKGGTYLQPELGIAIAEWHIVPPRQEPAPPRHPLSAKEMEVLKLLVHGYTNQGIAQEMKISLRTVESHRARILQKLGKRTRQELVEYAQQIGLFGPPSAEDEEPRTH